MSLQSFHDPEGQRGHVILKAILLHCVPDMGTRAGETHDVLKVTGWLLDGGGKRGLCDGSLPSTAAASFPRLGSNVDATIGSLDQEFGWIPKASEEVLR